MAVSHGPLGSFFRADMAPNVTVENVGHLPALDVIGNVVGPVSHDTERVLDTNTDFICSNVFATETMREGPIVFPEETVDVNEVADGGEGITFGRSGQNNEQLEQPPLGVMTGSGPILSEEGSTAAEPT